MAAVLWRVRSWLRLSWRTGIVLAVLVAVVVAVVLTVVAGAVRTVTAPDRYEGSRPVRYDVEIQQASGPPRVDELRRLPALERVASVTFTFLGLNRRDTGEPTFGLPFSGDPGAIGTELVEGRPPDPDEPGEFVATREFLAASGAALGDEFEVSLITEAQAEEFGFEVAAPAGPRLTGTLVGIVDPGPSGLQQESPIVVFGPSLLELGDVGVATTISVATLAATAATGDLRAQLDGLPDGDTFSLRDVEVVPEEVRTAVDVQGQGLGILAATVAGAALVVLGQLLSRQFRPSDSETAVLRSVGFTRTQSLAEPVGRAALVAVPGAAVGSVVAYLNSDRFPLDFVRQVEPRPGRRFDAIVHGLGPVLFAAILLLVLAVLAAPARSDGQRIRPSRTVDRLAPLVPGAPATALRFAFTRAASHAGTAPLPVAGLVLVMALLFGSLTFGTNLDRLLDDPAHWGQSWDLGIGAGGDAVPAEAVEALDDDPDVAALMLVGATTVAVGDESLGIVATQPVRGDLAPEVLAGRLPQSGDEVALGRVIARRLDLGVGDELAVSGASGPLTLRVSAIAIVPGVDESDLTGEIGLVTAGGLRRIDPDEQMSSLVLDLRPGAAAGTADRLGELIGMSVGRFDLPSAVINLDRISGVPYLVAGIVGALALLSLGHFLLVAGRRRRRDFAVLRALGATSRWLTGVVHWQASLTTALIVAVAIPVGLAAGSVLYRPYAERIGARTDTTLALGWTAGTLLGLAILTNVVAALPARRIRRDSPTRVLAGQ